MSRKTKVLKYKVVNTNIDKKFIGKNLDLERVKTKGGPGDGGRTPGSKNKITLAKLAEQMADLTKTVKDGFANVNHRIDNLVKVNGLKE